MKKTLNTNQIADALRNDQNANWSWAGARALAEYLEELEEETGTEMELDIVAIRCDYSEYEDAIVAAEDCGGWEYEGDGDDDREKAALSWLKDEKIIIRELDNGGVIIQNF